jgi:hypothetical protein
MTPSIHGTRTRFAEAVESLQRLPSDMERDIDTALAILWRVRDRLASADENIAACRMDEAMEKIGVACRVLTESRLQADWEGR